MSICSVGAEGEGERLAVAYLFQKFALGKAMLELSIHGTFYDFAGSKVLASRKAVPLRGHSPAGRTRTEGEGEMAQYLGGLFRH